MHLTQAVTSLLSATTLAFLVTLLTAPPVIRFLRQKKLGQQIRDDGPRTHLTKAGTPTMGGVVILAGLVLGCLLAWKLSPDQFWYGALLVGLTVAVAAIGSIDDWGKIKRGRSLGLRAREKLILQFVVATLFVAGLLLWGNNPPWLVLPGVGAIDLHWWYWPVAVLLSLIHI